MTDTPTPERLTCPDGGTCHHECQPGGRCWRVDNAGPLSGVYEGDRWPDTPTPDDTPRARAWVYTGERRWIEGVPFGSEMNPGDHYVSTAPIHPGDTDLAAELDRAREYVDAHLAVEGLIADFTQDMDAYNTAVDRFKAAARAYHDQEPSDG